ncbi:MAG: hypothetical protein DMG63_00300 [Acidobacteria bacterium]|nr:MAG: hypothetical protein DMG63_00300 [Acidobacteriota bacterium]
MRHVGYITLLFALLMVSAGAQDDKRKIVSKQDPQYPEIAKQMNLHGTVKRNVGAADGQERYPFFRADSREKRSPATKTSRHRHCGRRIAHLRKLF